MEAESGMWSIRASVFCIELFSPVPTPLGSNTGNPRMVHSRPVIRLSLASIRVSKKNGLSKENHIALAEFRFALRKFFAFSEQAATSAGLTPLQHQVLLAIKGQRGRSLPSIGDIADWLFICPPSAVALVDRLADLELVERTPDTKHANRILVSLTKAGDEAIDALSAIHIEELESIRPTLRSLLKQFESRALASKNQRMTPTED